MTKIWSRSQSNPSKITIYGFLTLGGKYSATIAAHWFMEKQAGSTEAAEVSIVNSLHAIPFRAHHACDGVVLLHLISNR